MNAAFAAALAGATTLVNWRIAHAAARRRSLSLGTLPPALPVLAAIAAADAAGRGLPPPIVAALAGATVAGLVDARTGFIFDPLTAAVLFAALGLAVLQHAFASAVCGGLVLGAALFALHALTAGRGMGLGDVKFAGALGVALGVRSGSLALAAAFVFGGIYGAWLLATRRARAGTPLRFGPFLAAGTFAAVLAR